MDNPGLQENPKNPTLQIDFTWRNFKARISDRANLSDPIYIVDFKVHTTRCIVVKSAIDETTVGAGIIHIFSIHPDYELHGRKGTIKALKRWKTSYTHLSNAFAPSPDSTPVTMTWTSSSNFKTWDFVCLDDQQMPVAKFSGNLWGVKKIGNIEFLGPKSTSVAARDEIVVTGLTLFYTMIIRTSSLLSFFGAIFARTGPIKDSAATTPRHDITGPGDPGTAGPLLEQEAGNKELV
ncbi:MAG: hypothetical protein Q9216_002618 [Gyalolechia sp. 2 TL-2023]